MSQNKGVSVSNCPIDYPVCYPSCYYWRGEKCRYPKRDPRTEKELEDRKAMEFK